MSNQTGSFEEENFVEEETYDIPSDNFNLFLAALPLGYAAHVVNQLWAFGLNYTFSMYMTVILIIIIIIISIAVYTWCCSEQIYSS